MRAGYDGTYQTPSVQLPLQPTGSYRTVHVPLSQQINQKPENFASVGTNMASYYSTPKLDPFGKMKSRNSNSTTTSEDEDMEDIQLSLLEEFDEINYKSPEDTKEGVPPFPLRSSCLPRSTSWAPGYERGDTAASRSQRSRPELLRSSLLVDPVASQLLRACLTDEEECQDEQQVSPPPNSIGLIISEKDFLDISDKLLDVKTEDDIRSLARPVPLRSRRRASHTL